MATEFNGFSRGVIGKKLPSDTTLNNMKKADLIKQLHIAQHNYDSLMWFYSNAVNVNMRNLEEMKSIRNKAIDEFAHELKETLNRDIPLNYESTRPYFTLENARLIVDEVADLLKMGIS